MNREILCVYYSRTGHTRAAAAALSERLRCELLELDDGDERRGPFGYLRAGLEAVRVSTPPLPEPNTRWSLDVYRLVVLGTPVWAGRCSSVMRTFLDEYGLLLRDTAFLITHQSDGAYPQVFRQMDRYLPRRHVAEVSLRPGSAGYDFWLAQFAERCAAFASEG